MDEILRAQLESKGYVMDPIVDITHSADGSKSQQDSGENDRQSSLLVLSPPIASSKASSQSARYGKPTSSVAKRGGDGQHHRFVMSAITQSQSVSAVVSLTG